MINEVTINGQLAALDERDVVRADDMNYQGLSEERPYEPAGVEWGRLIPSV